MVTAHAVVWLCGRIVVIAVAMTGCYGEGLYSQYTNKESLQWLCDRCFCGNSTDVRMLFSIQNKSKAVVVSFVASMQIA